MSAALGMRTVGEGSPSGPAGPEALKRLVRNSRYSGDVGGRTVISKAAECDDSRPRSHRTGVVMATFSLVPRVTFLAIVPGSYVVNAFDALVDHAGVDHESGSRVLEARHDLGEVREWNVRTR